MLITIIKFSNIKEKINHAVDINTSNDVEKLRAKYVFQSIKRQERNVHYLLGLCTACIRYSLYLYIILKNTFRFWNKNTTAIRKSKPEDDSKHTKRWFLNEEGNFWEKNVLRQCQTFHFFYNNVVGTSGKELFLVIFKYFQCWEYLILFQNSNVRD